MKKLILAFTFLGLLFSCTSKNDGHITIKGKVQFDEPRFKMEITKREGFDKIIIDTFDINPDGTYEYTMKVDKPGVYTLDCKKWESVNFWAEDEDLEINFRGKDTAKVVIKTGSYVHINGGPLNEVMNLSNYEAYRNYQMMIALSQIPYSLQSISGEEMGTLTMKNYDLLNREHSARIRYIVEHYGNRRSIIAVLPSLNKISDAELIDATITKVMANNPDYALIQEYKAQIEEERYQRERLAIGKPAPVFKFPAPDGKEISNADYKGKILLVDFWASWCGPCRQEIPHVKEVYAKYNQNGVEVLSVSIDGKKDEWLKALDEEKMPWAQILAPEAGKEIMKEYQFSGIPYLILLDRDGKIAAKNIRGKGIDKAIDELLAKEQ